ncbi:hypothetical protein IQ07DRAFT_685149 [Pyrenochaeta sp. DS3sAY3a]|nr:hypothetical protein IQ07DRAFT_685149 [Pyrenochaeta sp. DS3sAY3a]
MHTTIPKTTLLLHILNATIGALCVAVLGLVAHSTILKDELESYITLTPNVHAISMSLLFWPGVGGVVDMLLFIFIWRTMAKPGRSIKMRVALLNGLLFVAAFILVRPFIVLVYTFVAWGQAVKNTSTSTTGNLTVESWACALYQETEFSHAKSLCTKLKVARYLLIPILVLAAVMLGVVLWERMAGRKKAVEDLDKQ